jgi:hypothetical protein
MDTDAQAQVDLVLPNREVRIVRIDLPFRMIFGYFGR